MCNKKSANVVKPLSYTRVVYETQNYNLRMHSGIELVLFLLFPVNKQLADKERVAAALENSHLLDVVNQCLTINER